MIWDVLIDRKGVNRIQTELLLRKVQSGDTGALDTLITAYYPQILNYCRWHTADEQQAQDAARKGHRPAIAVGRDVAQLVDHAMLVIREPSGPLFCRK